MYQWERAHEGLILGVCKGLARQFDVGVWFVRGVFLFFSIVGGLSLFFYLILGFSMPYEYEPA